MGSRYSGPLRAYRIADERFPLFDGGGAAQLGGRWNSPGRRAIYGALSHANAMLEKLAQTGIGSIPARQQWIAIEIPTGVHIEEVDPAEVPGWDGASIIAARAYGDRWLDEQRSAVLVVPSVIGWPNERNVVINQEHPDSPRLRASAPSPVRWNAPLAR